MTDQEKKRQRAELQIELEDAQSDLAFVNDQALAMAADIGKVIAKLESNARLIPSKSDSDVESELANRLDPSQELDIPSAIKLISAMRLARQKVYALQTRKANLANTVGWSVAS